MQTDERLVALVREGDDRAFELLVNRYQPRLLAYCRRMVSSPQDAEDVLQEVFAAAHAGILAHDRPISAGPWLYRIARNRCVNHLRRRGPAADGVDSMDVHAHENGASTLERVQHREELRAIVTDVHQLPKTQRTALVLRQIDDLSYGDIAQTMGKSLPSVKSLLIRARTSLAESSAGRAALAPFGLLALLRKLIPAKLGGGSSAAGAAATGIGGAGAKAAVGLATAALLTAGAVGVSEINDPDGRRASVTAKPGGAEAPPATGTAAPGRSSAAARRAGPRAAGDSAGARSSTAKPGSGSGAPGSGAPSTTAGSPVEPAPAAEPPALPVPSVDQLAGDRVAQAAAPVKDLVPPPAASAAAAVTERIGGPLPAPTGQVLPRVGLGPGG